MLLKNLSISLYGLFLLELLYFYPNKIFARDLDKKILKEISIYYDQLESSNVNISSIISKSTKTFGKPAKNVCECRGPQAMAAGKNGSFEKR